MSKLSVELLALVKILNSSIQICFKIFSETAYTILV